MRSELPAGLLMARLRVPLTHDDEFNAWYNTEHLAQIAAVPGVLTAHRYRAREGYPAWYMALYELRAPSVYDSDAFRAVLAGPTPWSRRIATLYGANREVTVGQLLLSIGAPPAASAPCVFVARMDVHPSVDDEFNTWYSGEHVPMLAAVPGCLRVRRFVSHQGAPKYTTIYEFTGAEVLDSVEWVAAREHGRTVAMRTLMQNVSRTVYTHVFTLE
jgi:hypothetical protein